MFPATGALRRADDDEDGMTFLTTIRTRAALMALAIAGPALLGTQALARAQADQSAATAPAYEPAQSLEGNYLAAIIAGASRDTAAAAIYFREALRADPRNAELLERAFVVFLADGSMSDAFRAAERIVQREPDNGLAHLALGVRSLKSRQYALARQHLQKGGRGRAADITATLLAAWSWTGSGNAKRALETADRLAGESSFNVFRDYHAGLIADVSGNKAEAARRLKGAYDSEKTTLRVVDMYGRFEAARGNRDKAREVYAAFDKLAPRQPIVRDALARLDKGQPLPPYVTNAQEGAAEVLYGLGAAGGRQDDGVAAMIYLRMALHLDPNHVMALVMLGDILERAKQVERAIALYEQIPADSPVRASADLQIGLAYDQLERTEEAIAHLKELIAKRPDDIEAKTSLGNVLRNRKRFAEAAELYTQAIDAVGTPDSSNWTLFYFRGISLERSKQWPRAEADFKKALELLPEGLGRERALVLNYLGYSWADQNINVDEAFKMLRQAVELQPRDGYIVDSLGWAYYRLGRYEDAVRELERAVELRPADATINDHLGDAYWKVGRRLEARFQWTHARDLEPEPEDLVKIIKKLADGLPEDAKPAAAGNPAGNNGG